MSDPMVLATQMWLNNTYGGNSQWTPLFEDGSSGWRTMFGLIRGLQIELGISTLTDNFGPTTRSRFAAQYGVVNASTNSFNVVRLVQGGLWCKGYTGGYVGGTYDSDTHAGVVAMLSDMGVPVTTGVNDKVLISLFSMDAYKTIGSGTAAKRTVQKWLNGTYLSKPDFKLLPCDGLYSRNTQQGLMMAIQYEANLSQPNGNFGPGTSAALQNQAQVSLGSQDSTKNWTRLFQGALRFNDEASPFSGSFDADTRSATISFQSRAALTTSGSADFRTWASLLVSTGDASRPGVASDMSTQLTASHCALLYSNGYRTVGRYLTVTAKRYTPGELDRIFAAGLKTFPIMQEANTAITDFSTEKGTDHARQAVRRLRQLGFKEGATVFFAVDLDASDEEITSAVIPYFQGIQSFMQNATKKYQVGVYGTRNVCSRVGSAGLASESFIAGMSWGWGGNLGFPLPSNWSYDQIQGLTLTSSTTSLEIDKNIQSSRATPVGASGVLPTPVQGGGGIDLFDRFFWMVVHVSVLAESNFPNGSNRWKDLSVLNYMQVKEPAYTSPKFGIYLPGPLWQTPEYDCWVMLPQMATDAENSIEDTGFVPKYGVEFGTPASTSHFAVVCGGYARYGAPPSPSTASVADLGGWALDLVSLWVQYAEAHPTPRPSGGSTSAAYFRSYLGTRSLQDAGNFSFDDLVSDIDGYLVGSRLALDPALRLDEALRSVMSEATRNPVWRFSSFFNERFGGSRQNAKDAAMDMFISGDLGVALGGALTIGGMDLPLKALFTNLDGPPTVDEQIALAEAWADLLVDLATDGPTASPQ